MKAEIICFHHTIMDAGLLKIGFLFAEYLDNAFIPGVIQHEELTDIALGG
jgi:hypothetical protein